jgi:hypothetical protein
LFTKSSFNFPIQLEERNVQAQAVEAVPPPEAWTGGVLKREGRSRAAAAVEARGQRGAAEEEEVRLEEQEEEQEAAQGGVEADNTRVPSS